MISVPTPFHHLHQAQQFVSTSAYHIVYNVCLFHVCPYQTACSLRTELRLIQLCISSTLNSAWSLAEAHVC